VEHIASPRQAVSMFLGYFRPDAELSWYHNVQQEIQTAFHTEALARLVMLRVCAGMPDSHCALTAYASVIKDDAQVCSSIYMLLA